MTIICALSKDGKTSIAANTGYNLAQDSKFDAGAEKWISFQDWALGITGSMLALNVLRSNLTKGETALHSKGDVATEIGTILTDYDIGAKLAGETTWSFGIWGILVHADGSIWDVDESLSLGRVPTGHLWARGSGEKYALGAASAVLSLEPNLDSIDVVRIAASSAIANDLYCPGSVFANDIQRSI